MPFTAKVITTAQWGARDVIESFDLTKPMYIVIDLALKKWTVDLDGYRLI
jgi:hypothetical protein